MNNSTYKKTNVEFRVGDGNNIKIKDKFDTVISFETIEHLKEGQKFIHSLYNLLNKNGTLVLSTPDHKFKDLFFGGKILMKYHLKEYYQEEMAELLKKVGFQEIQIYYYHIAAKKFKYLSFIYFFLKRGFKVLPKTKKVVPINMIFVARKK